MNLRDPRSCTRSGACLASAREQRGTRLRGVARALGVGALLIATSAAAQDRERTAPPFALQPGITCLESKVLAQRLIVAERARHVAAPPPDVLIEVRGSAHDSRTAVISARRAEELLAQRVFSPGPPGCADFHDAVALAIAMMLETLAPAAPVAAEPAPPARTQPSEPNIPAGPLRPRPSARLITIVRAGEPATKPGATTVLSLRASALLATHVEAQRAAGLRVELAAQTRRLSLAAGILALFSASDRLADSQVRYATRPLAASLQGCVALLDAPRIALRGCLGALLGRIQFHADDRPGVQALHAASRLWGALQAGLELAVRLGDSNTAFASVGPVYGTRQLGVMAAAGAGDAPAREKLPRLGALFAVGLTYDVFRQGSPASRHE